MNFRGFAASRLGIKRDDPRRIEATPTNLNYRDGVFSPVGDGRDVLIRLVRHDRAVPVLEE